MADIMKCCKRRLKQRQLIVSQASRLEVQDRGVSGVGSFRELRGKIRLMPRLQLLVFCWQTVLFPDLKKQHQDLCLHFHIVFSLYVSVSKFPLWIRTSVILDWGPSCSTMTSSQLITSAVTLSPNKITFPGTGA